MLNTWLEGEVPLLSEWTNLGLSAGDGMFGNGGRKGGKWVGMKRTATSGFWKEHGTGVYKKTTSQNMSQKKKKPGTYGQTSKGGRKKKKKKFFIINKNKFYQILKKNPGRKR